MELILIKTKKMESKETLKLMQICNRDMELNSRLRIHKLISIKSRITNNKINKISQRTNQDRSQLKSNIIFSYKITH